MLGGATKSGRKGSQQQTEIFVAMAMPMAESESLCSFLEPPEILTSKYRALGVLNDVSKERDILDSNSQGNCCNHNKCLF